MRIHKVRHADLRPAAALALDDNCSVLDIGQVRHIQAAKLEGAQPAAQCKGNHGRIPQRIARQVALFHAGKQSFNFRLGVLLMVIIAGFLFFLDGMQHAGGIIGNHLRILKETKELHQGNHIGIAGGHLQPASVKMLVEFGKHQAGHAANLLFVQQKRMRFQQPALKAPEVAAVLLAGLIPLFFSRQLIEERVNEICHACLLQTARTALHIPQLHKKGAGFRYIPTS